VCLTRSAAMRTSQKYIGPELMGCRVSASAFQGRVAVRAMSTWKTFRTGPRTICPPIPIRSVARRFKATAPAASARRNVASASST